MPAGAGRDPAAERRVLERLGKVAQGQPVLAQLLLQPRPGGTGLDPRRHRLRIDLQHPVEPSQVERDEGPIPKSSLDPTDHTRPAAEGNDRRPLGLRPAEHSLDLRLVLGQRHQIRRILEFPPKSPHDVPIRLPQRPRNPLVLLIREQVTEIGRHLQPRRPHLDLLQRNRLLYLPAKAKPGLDPSRSLLQLLPRGRLILIPPPPVLEPALSHQGSIAG